MRLRVESARRWGSSAESKAYYEWNAVNQVCAVSIEQPVAVGPGFLPR
jgi:hypothetical protein